MFGTFTIARFNDKARRPGGGGTPGAGEGPGSIAGGLLRKVLVVDDERDLADMAAALLHAHGLDVAVAYSAREAIDILGSDADIDAVFSDVVMPGMTGLELADVVSEMYPRVKVVLASGYTQPAALASRDKRYLFTSKPYQIDTILKLLRS
jgi:two-component system, OmpR family, response regulator